MKPRESRIAEVRHCVALDVTAVSFAWFFLFLTSAASARLVTSINAVGMTVSGMEQSIEFFSKILGFEKLTDVEVHGSEYEKLQGLFGLRMRVVRLKLGTEKIELTQYLTPEGLPIPSE